MRGGRGSGGGAHVTNGPCAVVCCCPVRGGGAVFVTPFAVSIHAERVAREIGAMEQTIKEQDDTNEKLRASAALHREEADIMQQIIRVRDKEVGPLHRRALDKHLCPRSTSRRLLTLYPSVCAWGDRLRS